MTISKWIGAVVAASLLLGSMPAQADDATSAAGPARGDGALGGHVPTEERDDDDGRETAGIVLMGIGIASFVVGATILVVRAGDEPEETSDAGLDPGLSGVRGRGGQAPVEETDVASAIGVSMLAAGALIEIVGVCLLACSGDPHEPTPAGAASVKPLVGPGFGGVHVRF